MHEQEEELHVVLVDHKSFTVLSEALELHVEGLKEAIPHVTVDPNIDDPQDLVDLIGTIQADVETGEFLLKEVFNVDVRP